MTRRNFTHRMYVDEVGNHHMTNLGAVRDPNHQYLSLTGLIFELDHIRSYVAPRLEQLKHKHFDSHPDDPFVLHRKELVNKNYPFDTLRDPTCEATFNSDILELIKTSTFTAITIVIDKQAHAQIDDFAQHPYHHCADALVERYAQWLEEKKAKGDILFEHRGKNENGELVAAMAKVFENGTTLVSRQMFKERIIEPVQCAPKSRNVAGLQLADLIAHPAYVAFRSTKVVALQSVPNTFGQKIVEAIEPKYRRRENVVDGHGRKWLP